MSNLGKSDIGDTVRLEVTLTNISEVQQNAETIQIGVVNFDSDILLNLTSGPIYNSTTGIYYYDLYLDNSTYAEGIHYIVWAGNLSVGGRNISFYNQEDYFYIKEKRI